MTGSGMDRVTESIQIAATPDVVYRLVADVGSVGRFSPEATGAVRAESDPRVGNRFWGVNRRGPWIWATHCRVLAAEPGRRFAFDVDVGPFGVSRWEYDITADSDGCTVTETWTDRRSGLRGRIITVAGSVIIPGPRAEHNRRNIRESLAGLKRLAESPGEERSASRS